MTFLGSITPRSGGAASYDVERVKEQARRGAAVAVNLLKEYGEELEALTTAMEGGGGLADCVAAIEGADGGGIEECVAIDTAGSEKDKNMKTLERLQNILDDAKNT